MLSRWKLVFISLAIFSLVIFSGCSLWTSKKPVTESSKLAFIQPFNLFFSRSDFHVMLYFEGHPKYEAVEAMITEWEEKNPFIRVITTRHNQTQIDYINDQQVVEGIKHSEIEREVYYTPIRYYKDQKEGKPHILLNFNTFEGESVSFDFYAATEPSPEYAGLIDPGGHAEKSSLPIMWHETSSLASPKSEILFDGKSYEIPVQISIPPYFKGMKGYYSEGFSLGVIRAGQVELELVKAPQKFRLGEEWIYKTNTDEWIYRIVEINENRVIIQKDSEVLEIINAIIVNGHLEIEEIKVTSNSGGKGVFAIEFDPPLPDIIAMAEGQKLTSNFSISMDDHKAVVTGTIELKKEAGRILLSLNPKQPNWAVKRAMEITINSEDDKYQIKSVMKGMK